MIYYNYEERIVAYATILQYVYKRKDVFIMRNEKNMKSYDIEFFNMCPRNCKFCILQNMKDNVITLDEYHDKRSKLLSVLKDDIKYTKDTNPDITHINIHFSGGDFINIKDMVQYIQFLKDINEFCGELDLELETYLTTNLLYIDKDGIGWKYEDMDELRAISNVFTMTTHVNTSYSPEGRFNTAEEVVIWITNLISYNYLRSLYKKEPINVIIPLTKAVVKYNHNNKVRGMLKRLYNKKSNDMIDTIKPMIKPIIDKGIYSFLREQNIPYTFTPFMNHVLSEKSTEDNTSILYNKEYSDNEKYYKSDTYYHEMQDFLLAHAVGYSIGTEQLFRDNQFSSCMYNGNISCYTLDGEKVNCLLDKKCEKENLYSNNTVWSFESTSSGYSSSLCKECGRCKLIVDNNHTASKLSHIEKVVISNLILNNRYKKEEMKGMMVK